MTMRLLRGFCAPDLLLHAAYALGWADGFRGFRGGSPLFRGGLDGHLNRARHAVYRLGVRDGEHAPLTWAGEQEHAPLTWAGEQKRIERWLLRMEMRNPPARKGELPQVIRLTRGPRRATLAAR